MCAKPKLGRPVEWTQERLQDEADDLTEYSKLPDSLDFEGFACYRNEPYCRDMLYRLAEKSDYFRQSLIHARDRIRRNRERAVASGKMHQAVYAKTCTFYDRENSLQAESLAAHHKDMDRARRTAVQEDTVDTLKAANEAIQGLTDE